MKFLKYFTFLLTVIASHSFAPITETKPLTETEKIKALQKNFAKTIAQQEKAGKDTGGYATKRTFWGLGKPTLTKESKELLATKALMHKNNGNPYGEYADATNHEAVIKKATSRMERKSKESKKTAPKPRKK